MAKGACVLGSHGTVAIGEGWFLAGYHPQETMQTADQDTLPILSVKEATLPVLELSTEWQASSLAHIWWPMELLSTMQAADTILVLFLCLAPAHQYLPKKFIHSSGQCILISATAAQGTDHVALGASRAYICGLPELNISAYL